MHTNLDHDVFIKKGKSIALAQQVDDFLKAQGKSIALAQQVDDFLKAQGKSIALAQQVDDFLKAQGKSEPDQIPFGHSELSHKRKTEGYNAQSTMREIMFSSVQESKKNKSAVKPAQAPSPERLRRNANNAARMKAVAEGKTEFQGQCAHHGLQTFKIKSKGEEHICIICRDKHSVKQTIKRRKKQVAA